jgi:ribose transport system substrate-binding protein
LINCFSQLKYSLRAVFLRVRKQHNAQKRLLVFVYYVDLIKRVDICIILWFYYTKRFAKRLYKRVKQLQNILKYLEGKMKKRILAMLTAILMLLVIAACASDAPATDPATDTATTEDSATEDSAAETTAAEGKPFSVGITIQSLENAYWAGVFGNVDKILAEKGWDYTIVDCSDNAAIQIDQIENFISAGKDLIMVHPADPVAIVDACVRAREAGVIVMSWDDILPDNASDLNWILDNFTLGHAIGSAAGEFIVEHFTAAEPAKVGLINFPQLPILLERENGIVAGLEDTAPDLYEIVVRIPTVVAGEALSGMESALQANPDLKVVASLGAGGDVGANQAFMTHYDGNIPDDVGVFSGDASQQTLQQILNNEASRVTVGFEGSALDTAKAVTDLYEKLLTGHVFPEKTIIRILTPIDEHNAAGILADFN